MREIEGVTVGGVCDLSPALARFTAERFDLALWTTDYRELLAGGGADVVHVLTPPATHDRIVRDCLDHGCHVIVEKPIALSNESFRHLWRIARARGLMLIENHNYRFNEPILEITKAIEAGRIGRVEEIEVRMALGIRSGGRYADENLRHPSHDLPAGVIHEFITHLSYLLLYFMAMEGGGVDAFDLVKAAWRNLGRDELFKYDDLDAVIHGRNVRGRIRFTARQWPECLSVQVRGSDGVASAELFHPVTRVVTRRSVGQHLTPLVNSLSEARSLRRAAFGSVWRKVRNRTAYEGLATFLRLTYEALQNGGAPPVRFEDIDRTSRLVDAMLAEENQL